MAQNQVSVLANAVIKDVVTFLSTTIEGDDELINDISNIIKLSVLNNLKVPSIEESKSGSVKPKKKRQGPATWHKKYRDEHDGQAIHLDRTVAELLEITNSSIKTTDSHKAFIGLTETDFVSYKVFLAACKEVFKYPGNHDKNYSDWAAASLLHRLDAPFVVDDS